MEYLLVAFPNTFGGNDLKVTILKLLWKEHQLVLKMCYFLSDWFVQRYSAEREKANPFYHIFMAHQFCSVCFEVLVSISASNVLFSLSRQTNPPFRSIETRLYRDELIWANYQCAGFPSIRTLHFIEDDCFHSVLGQNCLLQFYKY